MYLALLSLLQKMTGLDVQVLIDHFRGELVRHHLRGVDSRRPEPREPALLRLQHFRGRGDLVGLDVGPRHALREREKRQVLEQDAEKEMGRSEALQVASDGREMLLVEGVGDEEDQRALLLPPQQILAGERVVRRFEPRLEIRRSGG